MGASIFKFDIIDIMHSRFWMMRRYQMLSDAVIEVD